MVLSKSHATGQGCHPHVTDVETKAEGNNLTCKQGAKLQSNPARLAARPTLLATGLLMLPLTPHISSSLVTIRDRDICADPKLSWVKKILRKLA